MPSVMCSTPRSLDAPRLDGPNDGLIQIPATVLLVPRPSSQVIRMAVRPALYCDVASSFGTKPERYLSPVLICCCRLPPECMSLIRLGVIIVKAAVSFGALVLYGSTCV